MRYTAAGVPEFDSMARLSLAPPGRHGGVDGLWWPCSRDAGAELPALIAAVDHRLGRTTLGVALHPDAWGRVPLWVPARGRQIRVSRARGADPRVVTLTLADAGRLILLIVPVAAESPPGHALAGALRPESAAAMIGASHEHL
ncbi:DUF5994 family protein [Nonomuraea diastatica]|uniref:Uncharacterized protein n=1 Tax=Nonomuraea diastatica TaxID=1848329 RepID=A0A4R4X5D5_9ACTN|nr:DUF5994 family protein [Nonomuraea diastatica]TDD25475.1 hypothetical protein E1294_02475 [Nonomuraea diastatica]